MLDFFLASLAERQPFTGLCDRPEVLRLHRLITDTPALTVRMLHYHDESERLLAEVLVQESSSKLTARLFAAQILGSQQVLIRENQRRILDGETADHVYPDAVANAHRAYRLLERGLGTMFRRQPET